MQKNHIFTNIVNGWKLEAKLEDPRYFYSYKEVDMILQNKRCYVIGRKGSGKSAICQHIISTHEYDTFSCKLSFKQFPFKFLYELKDSNYTGSNSYITIWKFIIYSSILKLMATNFGIDSLVREKLEKSFGRASKNLGREISDWTKIGFGLEFFGTGGSFSIERAEKTNIGDWTERTSLMEDIIRQHAGRSKYYIVFDELDEDYQDVTESQSFKNYLDLLKGLFKAVQDVKSVFPKESGLNIMPVVFLRNDIYAHIKDSDKTKWSDLMIELEWDTSKLKSLLAHRIYQDDPMHKGAPSFDTEWNRVFSKQPVPYGYQKGKGEHSFDFILDNTLMRPRDFIMYVKACCEEARDNELLISPETIHKVDRRFSNYLMSEFKDELAPILPDIDRIFNVLSLQRQWIFSPDVFKEDYQREIDSGNVSETNTDFILETLYNFSVIGLVNKNQKNVHYFKYINTNMTYNRRENIVLHRGLFKALGVV